MLKGWLRDPALWPKKRTLEMFLDWLDAQMLSTVKDIYMDETIENLE